MKEFTITMREHWLVLVVAIIVFGFIYWFYPHSDMGKKQLAEIEQNDISKSVYLSQWGILSSSDKAMIIKRYGVDESIFNPLEWMIEKSN